MADRVVSYSFRGNFANLSAGLTANGRAVQDFGSKLTALDRDGAKMRAGLTQLGATGGRVAVALGVGLGAAAKAAIDWESAWAGVTKTVDGSVAEMAALEDGLRNLAKTMPATHAEIAAVAEAAGQLGVAREDILDFTETMLQLAETTNLTADEAATSIAQMTNVMGTAPGDVDNLGAALVALGNDGASTERDIVQMAQRISAAGAQIGLAESDVLAIANAAASMGIEVEAGGSAVSRIFTEMAKATKQGGEDLESFAQVAGMSAQEFTTAFGNDPAQAFAAFTAGLDQINTSGGDVFTMLENLGLSDVRVQNALLSMASSGDLLTDSLTTGAAAWSENTALTDEYAKRLDTAGADARIAWNNIKDAGIEAGDVLLPVVSQVADGVSGMAQAFGSLPGPVKSAATGLAGIVAVTGGGLWLGAKVVSGIVDTRQALSDLGIEAGRTSGSLKTMVAAGAGLATVVITANVLQQAFEKLAGTSFEGGSLTRDIEALSDGRLTENTEKLAQSFRDVEDMWQVQASPLSWLSSWDPTGAEAAQRNIEDLDTALAGLTEGGQAETAAAAWREIVQIGQDQGQSLAEITDRFPEYATALENAAAAQGGLGQSSDALVQQLFAGGHATDQYAAAAEGSADANESEASAINQATQAMRDKRAEAASAFDAETRWGQAVADAAEAIDSGRRGINRFTEDGRANRQVLSSLAGAWNDLSPAAQNAEGRFASARRTFIDTATAMGVPREQARALARELLEIPRSTVANVSAPGAKEAKGDVDRLKTSINALRDKTVYIRIKRLGDAGAGPLRADDGGADGGTVRGQRQPYGDKMLYLLAPGEEIISNRSGQADRHRGLLKAINAGRAADGTTVGKVAGGGGDTFLPLFEGANLAAMGLKGLRAELKEATKAVDRETAARDAMLARREAVSGAVVSGLQNDLWATSEASGNSWAAGSTPGGTMDPFAAVQTRIDTAQRMIAAIKTLKSKGITGAALEEILTNGGLAGAEYMAAQSDAALAGFASDLALANQLSGEAGTLGAEGVVSNAELKAQTKLAAEANRRLNKVENAIEKVEKAIEKADKNNQTGHQATATSSQGWQSSMRAGHRRAKTRGGS